MQASFAAHERFGRRAALLLFGLLIVAPLMLLLALYIGHCTDVWLTIVADKRRTAQVLQEDAVNRELPSLLASARSSIAAEGAAYMDPSAVRSTTRMSESIQALLHTSGAEVRSFDVLPPDRTNGVDKLAIAIDLSIDSAKLPILLDELQRARPCIFAETFDISNQVFGAIPGMLWVRLKVFSFRLSDVPAN